MSHPQCLTMQALSWLWSGDVSFPSRAPTCPSSADPLRGRSCCTPQLVLLLSGQRHSALCWGTKQARPFGELALQWAGLLRVPFLFLKMILQWSQ